MRFLAAAILLLAASPAWACTMPAGGFVAGSLAVTPQPAPLPVNAPFALAIAPCGAMPQALAVDATMPAHRHGMNYRPAVTKTGDGFRADGLLFHMPGDWEFVFDVTYADGRRERLTHTVTVQ